MSDGAPVLDQLNLVVQDMRTTVEFYRRLGLAIEDTPPEWEARHRTATTPDGLDLNFDSIEFAHAWDGGWPAQRTGAVLGFRLASREAVDARYKELTGAGYAGQQEPYDAFWGARYAIIEDPDGNAVGLMSPLDPERRSPPVAP